jgi:beta-glucosidase
VTAPPDPTTHRFPAGFLLGASTAAHQIEGGNVNSDWWAMEHAPATTLDEPSGDAADSYHRWADDLDLVASIGLNAYRFSIEWARIEPAPGRFSQAALAHYRRLVQGCLDRGIEPVVTLHHFTLPRWFARAGGWTASDAVERFVGYVREAAAILDGVRRVATVNEPNMVAIMARVRLLLRGDDDPSSAAHDVATAPLPAPHLATRDALIDAHRAATAALHDLRPDLLVGWTVANQAIGAAPGGEAAAAAFVESVEDPFLRAAAGDDWIGVQAYTRNRFGPDGFLREDPEDTRTLTGWEYWPDAVGEAVRHTAEVVPGVPIVVTENGIATDDDTRRIAYTDGALTALAEAMADGIDVRGYLHWSLLDNYEWGSYHATFGLVGWDPATFERTPKPSARWLGGIARSIEPA